MRIAISPDENPGDPGAIANGIVERDVNVKVAAALEAALKRCGQEAWFDPDITFTQRIEKANSDGTQLLVACAHNAAGSPNAEGALFLFCDAQAHDVGHQQALADNCGHLLVQSGLVAHYGTYNEAVAECCDFNGDSLYVEFGYETNPSDAAHIRQPDYPAYAAECLAQGIAWTLQFPYAPQVHPSAPDPEWKQNLKQLPAPIGGVLAADVDVVNTISNEKVENLKQGTTLTVSYETSVRGLAYYMTPFAVEHATGYAIEKDKVSFESVQPGQAPEPTAAPAPTPQPVPAPAPAPAPEQPSLLDQLVGMADQELIALLKALVEEFDRRTAA